MELDKSLEIFQKVIENSPQAILVVNASEHAIIYHNKLAEKFFGTDLKHLIEKEIYLRIFFSATETEFEITTSAKNKTRIGAVSVRTMSWSRTPNEYRIIYINDITATKNKQENSNVDELTGIPRRNLFNQRVEEAISLASTNKGTFGLLYLDLDDFKPVNDAHGHESGDTVLKIVTKRIMACIRAGDVIGRLGGDEFGIILLDVKNTENIGLVAKKIIDSLEHEMKIAQDKTCFISASIGVCMYPVDGTDRKTLIRNADRAMYVVKHERGKGNFAYYSDGIVAQFNLKKNIETDLKKAVKDPDQFILHFMPQIDLETGSISAVETLTYWLEPTSGKLRLPFEFLPIAAKSNLIVLIEQLAFKRAGQQVLHWLSALDTLPPFRLIVNLSSHHFTSIERVTNIDHLIDSIGLNPILLDLELSESVMRSDPKAIKKLIDLRNKKIRITLDNYGSKETSLLSLKRFPITAVKIDRAFVRNILTEKTDRAIVKYTIQLANELGLKTIAQGVESEAQLELLIKWGCHEAQGYLFTKPLPINAFSSYLEGFQPPEMLTNK